MNQREKMLHDQALNRARFRQAITGKAPVAGHGRFLLDTGIKPPKDGPPPKPYIRMKR